MPGAPLLLPKKYAYIERESARLAAMIPRNSSTFDQMAAMQYDPDFVLVKYKVRN
jgi:hypothetical protein